MIKKVVFIGALENGRIVLQSLLKHPDVDVVAAYTYTDDIQKKKPCGTIFDDIYPNIRKVQRLSEGDINAIKELRPDLIFVAGWSQLLPSALLAAAAEGCIGFHPSKLPKDRGRSVLAWQIAEGYTETALTMFYLSEGVDSGDIIGQEIIPIDESDFIKDILEKVNQATYNLMITYLPMLLKGNAPRIPQDHSKATYRRLRKDNDSHINWDRPVQEIHNLVRAIAPPYPCAYTLFKGKRLQVLSGYIVRGLPERYWHKEKPGSVLAIWSVGEVWVKGRDGVYAIKCEPSLVHGFEKEICLE